MLLLMEVNAFNVEQVNILIKVLLLVSHVLLVLMVLLHPPPIV